MKPVTITEIAKRASVSIKTVSRVLNNEPHVSDSTRNKVNAVASELNYRPNRSARSLASNRSYVIVHFHDNPNSDYLGQIYDGAHKTCFEAGYFLVSEKMEPPYTDFAEIYINRFAIDGVILTPPVCDDLDILAMLEARNVPVVRVSPSLRSGDFCSVHIDDRGCAYDMTTDLVKRGHTKIGFLAGPPEHGTARDREAGFRAAIKDHGLSFRHCPIFQGTFSARSGADVFNNYIKGKRDLSALFAANDDMAIGVMMAAMRAGLHVPDDLAVAGIDGSHVGHVIWPRLSTVKLPITSMAERVSRMLLDEIESPSAAKAHESFPTELFMGGTS